MNNMIKSMALLVASAPVSAHSDHDLSSVYTQVLHWLTAPDHMLVIIGASVGIAYFVAKKTKAKSNKDQF